MWRGGQEGCCCVECIKMSLDGMVSDAWEDM